MSYTIAHGSRTGLVSVPSSKSELHRLLILAALGDGPITIEKKGYGADLSATAACLNALGADIRESENHFEIKPLDRSLTSDGTAPCLLPCGESGTTLRLLLPLAGLLGRPVVFEREGRLAERPIRPLLEALRNHGMGFREEGPLLYGEGRLRSGLYTLPGNISSQFVSALLLTLPLLEGTSVLRVSWPLESAPYVTLSEEALKQAGLVLERTELSRPAPAGADGGPLSVVFDPLYWIGGGQKPHLPGQLRAEGDYSLAAAYFCMGALSPEGIVVEGLNPDSSQGDKEVLEILQRMGAECAVQGSMTALRGGRLKGGIFNTADIPDSVPLLAMAAACAEGNTLFRGAGRLKDKESDRLSGIVNMLKTLGVQAESKEDSLLVYGGKLLGGSVNVQDDHRLAMAAAVAACGASGDIVIENQNCVAKSYGAFWKDFEGLKCSAHDE